MVMFALGIVLGLVAASLLASIWVRRRILREHQQVVDAERRAAEAEHLAELGTMTGGLAHEIKNPLSTIGLNADLLREDLVDLADVPEDERRRLINRLGLLIREISRLRGILDDFLQFAGRMHLETEHQDINALAEELADFFQPQASQAGVRLHTQLASSPAWAMVDSHLIKQAVLNLLINGTQAMELQSADTAGDRQMTLMLRVNVIAGEFQRRPQSKSDTASQLPDAPDEWVTLHVTDTGPGMSEENRKRIFQPYFSTKKGGTGLGLPTTRRIVDAHGGHLEVISESGRGTDFVIWLPSTKG